MKIEVIKLFEEVLSKYERAEMKNLESILNFGLMSYERQVQALKNDLKMYKDKLNELLK